MDITTILDTQTAIQALRELSGDSRLIWLGIFFAIVYIRTVIQNEKIITHVEDMARIDEEKNVKERIASKLCVFESALYEGLEQHVYSGDTQRKITIVRTYSKIEMPSRDYLRDYHSATKNAVYKIISPYWYSEIEMYKASERMPDEESLHSMALELRKRIFVEIHKRSGANDAIREIEDNAVTFESVLSFVEHTISYSQHCRNVRKKHVADETAKHRIPLIPNLRSVFSRKAGK